MTTTADTTCTECGRVQVPLTDIRLSVCRHSKTAVFICPKCGQYRNVTLTDLQMSQWVAHGVAIMRADEPLPTPRAPITEDEFLAACAEIEAGDPVELLGWGA